MDDAEYDKLLDGMTFGDVLRAIADLSDDVIHDFEDAS